MLRSKYRKSSWIIEKTSDFSKKCLRHNIQARLTSLTTPGVDVILSSIRLPLAQIDGFIFQGEKFQNLPKWVVQFFYPKSASCYQRGVKLLSESSKGSSLTKKITLVTNYLFVDFLLIKEYLQRLIGRPNNLWSIWGLWLNYIG